MTLFRFKLSWTIFDYFLEIFYVQDSFVNLINAD